MKKFSLSLAAVALLFVSCEKEEETKDPDKKDPVEVVVKDVEAPATYKFERNGKSSVSYSGQTTRISMAAELSSALLNKDKTDAQLKAMYNHQEGVADFENADLNASGKQLKNKTAASADFFADNATVATQIKGEFDTYIGYQASVFPSWEVEAAAEGPGGYGKAGYVEELGGKKRYVGVLGVEYNQVVAKSLIGALMADQILNNYTSTAVLDAGTNKADNDADKLADGKNYTTMEHKWDEAFGYLYGAEADAEAPTYSADGFLNKYLGKVDADTDFAGIAKTIYDAFKLGRAAIVAKNYEVRDAQAEIIRENISKVIAVRAVYYLQAGKAQLAAGDKGSAFHDLSEAIGFINSLQFTRKQGEAKPYFTKAEVDGFIYGDILKYTAGQPSNGLWSVESAKLDEVAGKIAAKFGFEVAKAGSLL